MAKIVECAWCGAECEGKYKSRRGEVFCSAAHRDASARAVKALRDQEEAQSSASVTKEDLAEVQKQVREWDVPVSAMTSSLVTITEYETGWEAVGDDGWRVKTETAAEALMAVQTRDARLAEAGTSSMTTIHWEPTTKSGLMVAEALCHRTTPLRR